VHVAVNTRLLLPDKLDGIGWFSHEVLKRLTASHPDWKFTFLFDRPFDERFIYGSNVEGKVLYPPTRHPLLYRLYFQRTLPHKLKALRPDLYFSPDGFLSTRVSCPQVPVIHDLNFEHRPQDLPRAYSQYYRSFFPKFAKLARRIITVSEYSAEDIAATYGISKSKISVAYNGYNEAYQPLSVEQRASAQTRFSQGQPYFVFVGNFSYRKNVHGIIKAYDRFRLAGGRQHLVLVGNPLWKYREMEEALQACRFQSDVHFTGRLPVSALSQAIGGAEALLFTCYFEGFGIPILEAFACNIPVITSDTTSLPEVAGKGGILCSPDDHEAISRAMTKLTSDERERQRLISAASEQLSKFSWDHTANKVEQALLHSLDLAQD
jgi:glycosyltransferase involved in cell wall biosynthesis